jgi:branched-subunit amino acid transport protein AzlD
MTAITFFTRVFPFLFFGRKKPPEIIGFVGKYIPPVVITILVLYCLKDINLDKAPYGLEELLAVITVIVLHLWRGNPLLSIFGATVLYMSLLQSAVLTRVM